MKRIIVLLLSFLLIVIDVNAQELTATLQQGETMTPFYGKNAFIEAYKAAQDGAVITLSSGSFYTVDSITKQITIVGNSFDTKETYIYSHYFYRPSWSISNVGLVINADNVTIEGLYCPGVVIRNVSNLHISHCSFQKMEATHIHTNTIIESSVILQDFSLAKSNNCSFRNSVIIWFEKLNSINNPAFFSNCVLLHYYDYCCVEEGNDICNYESPYGVFNNCLLGVRHYSYTDVDKTTYVNYWQGFCRDAQTRYIAGQEYNKNAFFLYPYKYAKNSSGNWSESLCNDLLTMQVYSPPSNNYAPLFNELFSSNFVGSNVMDLWKKVKKDISYKGKDGTSVGIYGGSGFSEYSSIPHITESDIASDTDSNGKLSVKIKVSVNQ